MNRYAIREEPCDLVTNGWIILNRKDIHALRLR